METDHVGNGLAVKLPADIHAQLESARRQYRHLGQQREFLYRLRERIGCRLVERTELEKMFSSLRLPGDVDIAQISWRPDYDPFFYRQLAWRVLRTYLFRDEYISDLEKAVVAEIPQVGHASYIFSKPRNMDSFLALYAKVNKDDIRRTTMDTTMRFPVYREFSGTYTTVPSGSW